MPVFFRSPAAPDWLRKAVNAAFAQPLSPRALRITIIAGAGVVLVGYGSLASLLVLLTTASWLIPELYRELLRSRSQHQEMSARAEMAEASLGHAAEQRLQLEEELQRVRQALGQAEGELRKERQRPSPTESAGHPIFRRVGLDPSAPRFAIEAVRKAYRRTLHPDVHPHGRKAEAEKRFKRCEAAFDEIWRLRGFSKP